MRIIGGLLKGRRIAAVAGDVTRPTADIVRQAVFSALSHHIDLNGAAVIDCYCGSGAFAFEALSRGAEHAILIDISPAVCKNARTTARELGVDLQTSIVCGDALHVISSVQLRQADIIFVDPPYSSLSMNAVVSRIAKTDVVRTGGLGVFEHQDVEAILPHPGWTQLRRLEHGRTVVDILRREARTS